MHTHTCPKCGSHCVGFHPPEVCEHLQTLKRAAPATPDKVETARANLYKIQEDIVQEMARLEQRLVYLKSQQRNIRNCIHAVAKNNPNIIEYYINNPRHDARI